MAARDNSDANTIKPFLYSIAEAYVLNEAQSLARYCFVFPNKRNIVFFNHAFSRALQAHSVHTPHPATVTISEFTEELVPHKQPDRIELIFILYRAYRQAILNRCGDSRESRLMAESIDFNKFQRWADMLIGDFNDVDSYMVDPEQIFPNLSNELSISSNFISDEVLEEIKRHWDVDNLSRHGDRFWNHIRHNATDEDDPEGEKQGKTIEFLKLWQVMLDVYREYRRQLEALDMAYPGMAAREAADAIKQWRSSQFAYRRYVFVGFNMLTTAEETIFRRMRDLPAPDDGLGPMADFYFDNASPALRNPGNTAVYSLNKYIKEFKSLYDCVKPVDHFPKIEITGVGSIAGQAKVCGAIVNALYADEDAITPESLRRTAIVLPLESIVNSVLMSLPAKVSPVNLTMGYRLRDSRAAALVKSIVSLHIRARKQHGVEPVFYYEDVTRILTHPLLRQIFPDATARIISEITQRRIYNISQSFIEEHYPIFNPIFKYVENTGDADEVFSYFESLFHWLLEQWEAYSPDSKKAPSDADDEAIIDDFDGSDLSDAKPVGAAALVDRMLVRAYLAAINRLKALIPKYLGKNEIYTADTTLFHLLERLVGGETVHYEGRPLNGLQIMGVLETRGLDFENIIIPSMNERIFPRKHFQKSFIPTHLRRAYGMSTLDHQESIYSYYFYRMISRARRVFLLYDARDKGVGGGQPSRYISQLQHIYLPGKTETRVLGYSMPRRIDTEIEIRKTPRILKELYKFLAPTDPRFPQGTAPRKLSASSINLYINCPLSFYLSYIEGYNREDEIHDYMDASTFGTIVHGVFQDIYDARKDSVPLFNRESLSRIKQGKVALQQVIVRRINKHYNVLPDDRLDMPLTGDAEIFGNLIQRYVLLALDNEIKAGDFEYISSEYESAEKPLTISDGSDSISINFTYKIDRIDRYHGTPENPVDPTLRFIDYKTGADETFCGSVDEMFQDVGSRKRNKAMLQLFLYCQAYAQHTSQTDIAIQPWIYSIQRVATRSFEPLRIGKATVADYRDYLPEFNAMMYNILYDLFNPEIPFTMCADNHTCNYCKFSQICHKSPDKKW